MISKLRGGSGTLQTEGETNPEKMQALKVLPSPTTTQKNKLEQEKESRRTVSTVIARLRRFNRIALTAAYNQSLTVAGDCFRSMSGGGTRYCGHGARRARGRCRFRN